MSAFKTCLNIIEWTLFFGLCGLSIAFIWQALVQYDSKDSTFKRSEIPVKGIHLVGTFEAKILF